MYKRKHLFITLCTLFFASLLNGQIRGKLTLSEDQTKYEFYIIPNFDQSPPLSITNSAQISLVAPVGGLEISNFESVTGRWNSVDAAIVESPPENPNFSYVSIPLSSPMQDIVYEANQEILLFTFENSTECKGPIEVMDNATDPFIPPNSLSVNVGNLFTVLEFGLKNSYEGTDECCAPCPGEMLGEVVAMDSTQVDATPPSGEGTICQRTKSNIEIRLSALGTPPYIATWENTTTGEKDTINIAEINGPYILVADATPGIYEMLLVDAAGSRLELTEEVIDNSYSLTPQLIVTDASCESTNSGSIEVLFTEDPISTISYSWSNGATTSQINTLPLGEYEVTVTDNNGCSAIQTASIISTGSINAQIEQINVTCKGMDNGQLSVNIPNPESYDFEWEGNTIMSTENSISDLSPGTYSVTISDLDGTCSDIQSFQIEEPEELTITTQLLKEAGCSPLTENTILINTVAGASDNMQYALGIDDFSTENRFTVPTGQTYEITAMNEMGCTSTTSVEVPAISGLSVNVPEQVILELGEEMELNIEYESNNPVNIEWEDHPTLSCTDCVNPVISPTETTTYTLILSDDNGCSKDATIIVFISKTDKIYTPTAFSPNNDGINDYFNVFTGSTVSEVNNLQIFNRWGGRVFLSSNDYTSNVNEAGWNGLHNGQLAESGVYIYFAEVTLVDGNTEILRGEVSLLR